MSWKCDFCPQLIFTTKTSYTNHIKQCLKSVDSSEELSLEVMMIDTTVPDRMHHLDLGLFHYQIEFTQALLQKQDSSLVNKIDNRLSKIPRFQKFQIFTNGLQSISRMTAKEYRILMKVMVFVVDNLYKENENNVENFVENKKLSEVYAKWNKMYMMSRSEIFTESDLENFRKDTFEWVKLFVKIFKPYSRSKLKFSKFHSWIYHIFESIRQFDQIMKTLKRQDIINVINKKQKKKKPTKLLNFSSKLFETKLTEANIYFCEKMNDSNINDNMIKDNIFEVKNIKECDIIIYGTATLENGSIIRAKNKFHDKPWFSNVAISMDSNESSDYQSDEGLCYDPLFAEKGIDLEVDNKTFWFFPRISTIICDWPEAATFSLVYKSTNSNFPCHFCLISKTLLADTDLSDVTFRNNENMQEYFYNNSGQDVSLENIPNYFWSLPSINVYSATVLDRMHHLDLGLFHYQIEFTQALLQKQDSSLVNKIDNRLSKIPRFQKFQIFTNGLQSISRMTAKEYRILMKVMVFVVDNLYKENENNVENFVENKKLSEVYAKWNKMIMLW
ncbi:hypothetical protein Glove_113g57 [Diversispora epigaea]|uniref:Uncharacterized protein n=1 Tax=Diversispora epigaea TaxID=1348612 RepID=A0A397J434_9GLOM|nr:hypothetical protein Glove_113g57 [Diversispora epigaea]